MISDNNKLTNIGTITISVVTFVYMGIGIGVYVSRVHHRKEKPKGKTILLLSSIIFAIGFLIWAIFYGITANSGIADDGNSLNRMDELSQLMTSFFGPKWKYTIFINLILIIIVFILLYFATRKPITLNVTEKQASGLKIGWIVTSITFTIVGVTLLVYAGVINNQNADDTGDFKPSSNTYYIVAIFLALLVAIAIPTIVFFNNRGKQIEKA